MAPTKKRVVFSFNDRSLDQLEQFKERGGFSSLAEAVRFSLQISGSLQQQSQKGYTEIIVRNPDTNKELVMAIPQLSKD